MDMNISTTNEHIRQIEDIIDIQKASGNFSIRQVAFNLPTESESTGSNLFAKSLESGLSKSKSDSLWKNKLKKNRLKRHKSPIPDVISWPSDSDITVLRMKLCLNSDDLKEKVANEIPGDGLHQPDSSSMVNLATLMRQSQPPSKHSIMEEYLLPLTSWEEGPGHGLQNKKTNEDAVPDDLIAAFGPGQQLNVYDALCVPQNSDFKAVTFSENSTKAKIAKFLRLYFCPCCKCLYKCETMSDDPSTYWEKRKEQPTTQ